MADCLGILLATQTQLAQTTFLVTSLEIFFRCCAWRHLLEDRPKCFLSPDPLSVSLSRYERDKDSISERGGEERELFANILGTRTNLQKVYFALP